MEYNSLIECKNNVVRVKSDNELFLHQKNSAQEQFAHFMGEKKISRYFINNFNQNILENLRYVTDTQKKYCHVVFPAKPIIYKDKLKSNNVNVFSLYGEAHTKSNVIYPLECLYDDSCMEKYGTHYSGKGYFNVVTKMLQEIGEGFTEEAIYSKRIVQKQGLARMYEGKLPPAEQLYFESIKNRSSAIITLSNSSSLEGNSGKIIFKYNPLAPRKKRVLLFGDSFFVGLLDILSHIYEEVLFLRNTFILQDVANAFRPDIIFTGNAERYLVNTPSYLDAKPFFLHYINTSYLPINLEPDFLLVITSLLGGGDVKYNKWKESAFLRYFDSQKNKDKVITNDGNLFNLPKVAEKDIYKVASAAYSMGYFDVAIKLLEKSKFMTDENYFLFSKCFNRKALYSEAIDMLLMIKNKKYSHLEFLGDVYFRNNNIEQAIFFYNSAIGLNKSIYNAFFKLANLFNSIGDYPQAKEFIILAHKKAPTREVVKKLHIELCRNI